MKLDDIRAGTGEWLRGAGPLSEVAISSRARLARNIARYHFPKRMDSQERQEAKQYIEEKLLEAFAKSPDLSVDLEQTSPLDRKLLVERHLISREHAENEGARGVAVYDGESISVMINEEDHLRIAALRAGLDPEGVWRRADELDSALDSVLDYAYDQRLGFLTSCPTNVGTGLRISVLLHLPALVIADRISKVLRAVDKMKMAVRGMNGENTEATGHFFQISNSVTLGKSERAIVRSMKAVVPQIVRYEKEARQKLFAAEPRKIEDRVQRAYGMLLYARSVSSDEVMTLLSALRMGIHLGLLDSPDIPTVNKILLQTQPAHLQLLAGKEMDPADRDAFRADFIRAKLRPENN